PVGFQGTKLVSAPCGSPARVGFFCPLWTDRQGQGIQNGCLACRLRSPLRKGRLSKFQRAGLKVHLLDVPLNTGNQQVSFLATRCLSSAHCFHPHFDAGPCLRPRKTTHILLEPSFGSSTSTGVQVENYSPLNAGFVDFQVSSSEGSGRSG